MNIYRKSVVYIIVITLFALLCLSSCGADKSDSINISELYLFERNNGVIYKYNAVTGTYTPLCDDPLCEHDYMSECKFSSVYTVRTDGSMVYYYKDDEIVEENGLSVLRQSICSYDYESGKLEILYTCIDHGNEGIQGRFEYYDGYIYFFQRLPDASVQEFSLYRVNVKSKKTELISEKLPWWYMARTEDRLVFFENPDILYTTDFSCEDRQELISIPNLTEIMMQTYGDYVYYQIEDIDGTINLMRTDVKKGNLELVCECSGAVSGFYIYDGYIYFLMEQENPKFIFKDIFGNQHYNKFGGNIYRIKLNGSNFELWKHYDKDISEIKAVGRYIVLSCKHEQNGEYVISDEKITIDLFEE